MNADSYSKKIQHFILSRNADYVFGLDDLAHLATYDAIRQTLPRLVGKKLIERLFIGIYWVRYTDQEYPPVEDVLDAVARNNHWITAPGTDLARFELGLSTKPPAAPCYLSSGPSSKYEYCKTQIIKFQRCVGKYLLFADKRTTLLISALMDQKTHPITSQEIMHLSNTLSAETKAVIMKDRAYIPAKLRPIIEVICR